MWWVLSVHVEPFLYKRFSWSSPLNPSLHLCRFGQYRLCRFCCRYLHFGTKGKKQNYHLFTETLHFNLPGNWKTLLCDFYRMCLLSVSVRHKLVSCCLIVIKRSIRCVKLLLLAVTQELMLFRWWLFHVGHFPVSLSDAKTSKGQSSVAMYACKIFLHFSGVGWGGGGEVALVLRLHFTFVEETVQRTLFWMFTK